MEEEFDYTKITTLEQVCERMGVIGMPEMSNILESLRKPLLDTYVVMLIIACINNGWKRDFTRTDVRNYYLFFAVLPSGSGFSCSYADFDCVDTYAGSRLYIESDEKARHILNHFPKEFENYHLDR